MATKHSILLIGESNVGKTHYGAQFLKRLMVKGCALRMSGAATNLEPFSKALSCLTEGRATDHTPATTYVESVWPIADALGRDAELVWPDYGGEQVRNLVIQRKIPVDWRDRVSEATDWVILIRLHSMRAEDDIFARPFTTFAETDAPEDGAARELSDQARTIELLQMLLYLAQLHPESPLTKPRLTVLLSCWDELNTKELPEALIASRLPLFWSFVRSCWADPVVMGLSALERPLSMTDSDSDYAIQGPEGFGFVVLADGTQTKDITLPIQQLLAQGA